MMKIGVYTIHADKNFGAQLQAFATQYFLKQHGYDAEIVNLFTEKQEDDMKYKIRCNSIKNIIKRCISILNPKIRLKSKRLLAFHNMMSLSKRYYSLDEIYENAPIYDVHLVGSDQVWNIEKGLKKRNYYFLDFLKPTDVKISYASSFGNTDDVEKQWYPQLKQLLSSFKKISTREQGGMELIEKATQLQSTEVLDPTLLLSEEEWTKITNAHPLIKGDYILYYGFDKSQRCYEMIKSLSERLKMPIVAVSVNITLPYKVDRFYQEVGPSEFISLVKFASYVITSSFHGMAFSVNFKKNFFVMSNGTRMSRVESLLKKIDLENRIVNNKEELMEMLKSNRSINYESSVNEKINNLKETSVSWLLSSLANEIKV